MATTVLALVRHGQSEGNLSGCIGGHSATPLTELGHRQARAAARGLAEEFRPTALISSDLVRARQTAEPIAAACDVEVIAEPRLRERSLGVFDGLSFEDAQARDPEGWRRLRSRDRDFCPPGAETVSAVFSRVSAAIDHIAETHRGGRVAVVSHGIAIFHAFAHICGLGDPADGLKVFTLVANCSISTFRFRHRHDVWLIDAVNDCRHLDGVSE